MRWERGRRREERVLVKMGGCFSFLNQRHKSITHVKEECGSSGGLSKSLSSTDPSERVHQKSSVSSNGSSSPESQRFSFLVLANATNNFKDSNLIGQGGFGKVYKGVLETRQTVAIKLLDRSGPQGNREFMTEVLMLSILKHPNLVNLFGYCTTGDQRALVYEYMPMGSLENSLFGSAQRARPLDWGTRIKIAWGAARGLEYLHCKNDPPIIHRDLKAANILLDESFNSKLADFGLAKLGPVGDETHVSTRVMGTYGYCAPEYLETGKLTMRSDIYSFGVVLLELITGRKAYDPNRAPAEKNLVNWARPQFKNPRRLLDPRLLDEFQESSLKSLMALTEMCLQDKPSFRPLITDICVGLEYIASQPSIPETQRQNRY